MGGDGKGGGKGGGGKGAVWCFNCGGEHTARNCPLNQDREPMKCFNCGGSHLARDCLEPRRPKGGGKGGGDRDFACFNCGGDHLARDCPEPRREKGGGKGKDVTCFNCGGNHFARDCPEPPNEDRKGEKGKEGGKDGYPRKGKGGGRGKGSGNFGVSAVVGKEDAVCMLYLHGYCPLAGEGEACPRGKHVQPKDFEEVADEETVLFPVTRSKLKLLEQKWKDAGGRGLLHSAWQVKNKKLEFMFRATEHNLTKKLGGKTPDCIDGWHGTAEGAIFSIAINGFDTFRRSGQAFGEGEYFAKNPNVSIGYCGGGKYMFLCKLALGLSGSEQDPNCDHRWIEENGYYVINQKEGDLQALPMYVVQFQPEQGALLDKQLSRLQRPRDNSLDELAAHQKGGKYACPARSGAGMTAESTQYLWLGWLDPTLTQAGDDEVFDDVAYFLSGQELRPLEVIPERNGARIGAFVKLERPINQREFKALQKCRYHDKYEISVDDQQLENPAMTGKRCPRWTGPSKYCRGWNLRGHFLWNWGCSFDHPLDARPTHGTRYALEDVDWWGAKTDEIWSEIKKAGHFESSERGGTGTPTVINIQRVNNRALEEMYKQRVAFLNTKHGYYTEKDLWHGTHCGALDELLTHGLQPPSDTNAHKDCPRSGGKGLSTTLCNSSCEYCEEAHAWHRCHMYGLGIYLADLPQKSHRYVRAPVQVSADQYRWIKEQRESQEAEAAAAVVVAKPAAPTVSPDARYLGSGVEDPTGRHLGIIKASVGTNWRLANNMQLAKSEEGKKWRLAPGKLKAGAKVKVLASPSVAYRNTPKPQDRKKPDQVENHGNIITVTEQQGDWVKGANGWLPMRAPTASGTTELLQWENDPVKATAPGVPGEKKKEGEEWNEDWWVFSLIRCRVCLGNPYLIEGNLMNPDSMHNLVWCKNPEDELETVAEEWDVAKGHDSYFVKGQEGHQAGGLGVHNNEYIVFHPFQVLPLYKVDYTIS